MDELGTILDRAVAWFDRNQLTLIIAGIGIVFGILLTLVL